MTEIQTTQVIIFVMLIKMTVWACGYVQNNHKTNKNYTKPTNIKFVNIFMFPESGILLCVLLERC